MAIPLFVFLGLYVIGLIFCIAHGAMNVYHVSRFGAFDTRNIAVAIVFLVYTATIIVGSLLYFIPVDWGASLTIPLPTFSGGTPGVL